MIKWEVTIPGLRATSKDGRFIISKYAENDYVLFVNVPEYKYTWKKTVQGTKQECINKANEIEAM